MNSNHLVDMHDQYNARHLDASQIAEHFVQSSHFDQLAKSRNSVIAGPRGSGKTTLLRMLCQETLEQWPNEKGGNFREKISFTSVFIYTDVSWSELFNSIEQTMQCPKISETVIGAIITTRILSSFVDTLNMKTSNLVSTENPHRRTSISLEQEISIVNDLSTYWKLKPQIASLRGLKVAIDSRLADIGLLRMKRIRGITVNESDIPEYAYLDYSQAISSAIESFNNHTNSNEKWALLFDEMEFAPPWFLDQLFIQIRGNDPKFFIKLAVSPLGRTSFMDAVLSPRVANDYDSIMLWYAQSGESKQFCEKLWRSIIERRHMRYEEPSQILSDNFGITKNFMEGKKGGKDRQTLSLDKDRISKLLTEYTKKDKTFLPYLKSRGLTIHKLVNAKTEAERGSGLRKLLPIVLFRNYYFKEFNKKTGKIVKRSRKIPSPIYAGWDMLTDLSEGNPRSFIAMATSLLDKAYVGKKNNSGDAYMKLTTAQQIDVLLDAGNALNAMYKVHPAVFIPELKREIGIYDLVSEIGNQLREINLDSDFKADLISTFFTDNDLSHELCKLIEDALVAGAIVYLPNSAVSEVGFGEIKGKRFRLNYLLAPKFGFVPRLGKKISISKLISGLARKAPKSKDGQEEITFTEEKT